MYQTCTLYFGQKKLLQLKLQQERCYPTLYKVRQQTKSSIETAQAMLNQRLFIRPGIWGQIKVCNCNSDLNPKCGFRIIFGGLCWNTHCLNCSSHIFYGQFYLNIIKHEIRRKRFLRNGSLCDPLFYAVPEHSWSWKSQAWCEDVYGLPVNL